MEGSSKSEGGGLQYTQLRRPKPSKKRKAEAQPEFLIESLDKSSRRKRRKSGYWEEHESIAFRDEHGRAFLQRITIRSGQYVPLSPERWGNFERQLSP